MKYELETIPVWDAYKTKAECPICFLFNKSEEEYIRFYVGNSVMVPEIRVQVNRIGFCKTHYPKLLNGGNRLGLSLITHTHIKETRKKFTLVLNAKKIKSKLEKKITQLAKSIKDQQNNCIICQKLEDRINRYTYTIVQLWKTNKDFNIIFSNSTGTCLTHEINLLQMASVFLTRQHLQNFVTDLLKLQDDSWDSIEEDLLALINNFDYQSNKNSSQKLKSSIDRAINKLLGKGR